MAGEATQAIDKKVLWGGGRSPFSISYGKMMMWFFLISDALTFGGLLVALGYQRHHLQDIWPITDQIFFHFPYTHAHLPLMYVALMTFILIVSSVTMVLAVEAGHRMDKKGVIKWLGLTVIGGLFFVGSQGWEWATFIKGSEYGAYVMADGSRARIEITGADHGDAHAADGAHAEDGHAAEGHAVAEKSIQEKIAEAKTAGTFKLVSLTTGKEYTGQEAVEMSKDAQHLQGANLKRNEYGPQLYANFFFFITGFHGTHVFSGVVINFIILLNVIKGVYEKRKHYEMVEKVGLYWHFVDLVWVFVFTFFYLI